jgi:hypothetical protein
MSNPRPALPIIQLYPLCLSGCSDHPPLVCAVARRLQRVSEGYLHRPMAPQALLTYIYRLALARRS